MDVATTISNLVSFDPGGKEGNRRVLLRYFTCDAEDYISCTVFTEPEDTAAKRPGIECDLPTKIVTDTIKLVAEPIG